MTAAARILPAGTLLNGRVRYRQFEHGYRTGIEPVLLAAAIPARPGDRVLEAGSGAGAGLLCLAHRVSIVRGVGVEQDPALAALATANAQANGWQERLYFLPSAIETFQSAERFDHAFANPPWHASSGTASPDPGRAAAKRASPLLLNAWTKALATKLRHRGTLSLILPASQIDAAFAALAAAGCGTFRLIPLWPRAGEPARLAIVTARKGGRTPTIVAAGLVLHAAGGGYTEAADKVLRGGEALKG